MEWYWIVAIVLGSYLAYGFLQTIFIEDARVSVKSFFEHYTQFIIFFLVFLVASGYYINDIRGKSWEVELLKSELRKLKSENKPDENAS